MGNYGLKVSKLGSSTGTATIARNLQFTSKYSGLKFYKAGTLSVAKPGTATAYGTVAHDLGFEPAHFVWRKFTATNSKFGTATYPNAYSPIGAPNMWIPESDSTEDITSYTNSSDLVVKVNTGTTLGTYDFKYYVLVDLANDYSGTVGGITTKDYGFKVSKPGVDIGTAKEYQLVYSSKYKALQYYDESFGTGSISLPTQFPDYFDQEVYSGGYIDFYHGLGYPPFFFSFYKTDSDIVIDNTTALETPFYQPLNDTGNMVISSSCFATDEFIRLSILRFTGTGFSLGSLPAENVNFKLYTTTEDLSRGSL